MPRWRRCRGSTVDGRSSLKSRHHQSGDSKSFVDSRCRRRRLDQSPSTSLPECLRSIKGRGVNYVFFYYYYFYYFLLPIFSILVNYTVIMVFIYLLSIFNYHTFNC
ncbi:hypothetical protein LINPERPRIM_LOCUS31494, partial [Linum perenne]